MSPAVPVADHPLRPRLAGALVGLIALEGLLVGDWPAVAVAAVAALSDALGRRSPFALLAGLMATAARPAPPGLAVVVAVLRAAVLGVAAGLLAGGHDAAAAVLVGIAVLECLLTAVLGRSPVALLAPRRAEAA